MTQDKFTACVPTNLDRLRQPVVDATGEQETAESVALYTQ